MFRALILRIRIYLFSFITLSFIYASPIAAPSLILQQRPPLLCRNRHNRLVRLVLRRCGNIRTLSHLARDHSRRVDVPGGYNTLTDGGDLVDGAALEGGVLNQFHHRAGHRFRREGSRIFDAKLRLGSKVVVPEGGFNDAVGGVSLRMCMT